MTKARDLANAGTALGAVTATELAFVDGVTSAIQTQMDAKTAKATLTTTGDIYYASGANTPARLGIGSTGNVLTVASGIPSWAAPAGGGKVLQVVQATSTTSTSNTSSTYADSGLSASITPTLNTSKVLVLVSQVTKITRAFRRAQGGFNLVRNSTEIVARDLNSLEVASDAGSETFSTNYQSLNYLDSPATTSSTTYKTQQRTDGGTITSQFNSSTSTIILLEIGA